jgi:hypothetical protein
MYHACMHTRPPARSASRAAAPPPKVALFALEDNQSSAEALELTVRHASLAAISHGGLHGPMLPVPRRRCQPTGGSATSA